MISYYSSKNPGIIIYCVLILLSAGYFTFIPVHNISLGFLVLGWSGFTFMRALSLLEITTHEKPLHAAKGASRFTFNTPSNLAADLENRLSSRNTIRNATLSLNVLSTRNLLWLALAMIYLLCEIYLNIHDISPSAYNFNFGQKIAALFILSACFWTSQTYAQHTSLGYFLLWVFAATLAWNILNDNISFRHLTFPYTLPISTLIGIPLILYSFIMLIPSFIKPRPYALNGVFGIITLIFLLSLLLITKAHTAHISLFITGLALFSFFWIRSNTITKKKYTLRA